MGSDHEKISVGMKVYRRRGGVGCSYVVDEVCKDSIHLKCTHKGGRSLWKSIYLFWFDYERIPESEVTA